MKRTVESREINDRRLRLDNRLSVKLMEEPDKAKRDEIMQIKKALGTRLDLRQLYMDIVST